MCPPAVLKTHSYPILIGSYSLITHTHTQVHLHTYTHLISDHSNNTLSLNALSESLWWLVILSFFLTLGVCECAAHYATTPHPVWVTSHWIHFHGTVIWYSHSTHGTHRGTTRRKRECQQSKKCWINKGKKKRPWTWLNVKREKRVWESVLKLMHCSVKLKHIVGEPQGSVLGSTVFSPEPIFHNSSTG